MFAQRILTTSIFASIVLLNAVNCFALQSGSRGAVPSGSGTSASAAGQVFSNPIQSAPIQQVSPSQSFSTPSIETPDAGFSQSQFLGDGTQYQYQGVQPQNLQPGSASSPQSSSGGGGSLGVPEASLVDPIFQISDPNSAQVIDHSLWDCFLARYLVTDSQGINRIRYRQITSSDRAALQGYLDRLQATDIRTLNRNEQLAYWFNLYNARTVALVSDNYPIRSVRQIKQKFTDFVGPFDDEGAVNVLGKSLSLNDIESGIVRPGWNDPRIHYALNCASYGCPNLASTAWTSHDIDSRLNGAAYQFINSNRGVKSGLFGTRVSKIYKWYSADFGGDDQSVLRHISQYANSDTLSKINGRQTIIGYFYDWSLSDARILRPRIFESLIR